MLAKIRHYVKSEIPRTIYFGIFASLMNYGSQIWGQYTNANIKRIIKLQNKAIRIINFANYREPTTKLYQKSGILKFQDNIRLHNYLFVHDSMNRRLPACFYDKFQYLHEVHVHSTRSAAQQCVTLPKSRTLVYGLYSITDQSSRSWNNLQIMNSSDNLHVLSRNICKKKITNKFLQKY